MRLIILISCFTSVSLIAQDHIEFKGISLSMANRQTKKADITPIQMVNANWVAVVPYGFIRNKEVLYDSDYQWIGERPEGIRKCIQLAHEQGLKVMLKPHIWIGWGTYTGDFICHSNEEWELFEASYRQYIMTFVDMAIEEEVELFCIGTEWKKAVLERPEFWKDLIRTVKMKYDGDVTYAANWDEYQTVPFWRQLDFIGIDAYFPLSEKANPKLSALLKSWKVIMPLLSQFSDLMKRDIIFTEYGFQSAYGATVKPWEVSKNSKFSDGIQETAYKAFFQSIWKKSWFKGGFVWKWYHDHKSAGGVGNTDFTPQNKSAEETIREYYGG